MTEETFRYWTAAYYLLSLVVAGTGLYFLVSYVKATNRIAASAAEQAKAAQRQLGIMQEQIDAVLQPIITIGTQIRATVRPTPRPNVRVVLRNIGPGPGLEVFYQTEPGGGYEWRETEISSVIAGPIASGEKVEFDLALPEMVAVRVKYENVRGRSFVSSVQVRPGVMTTEVRIAEVHNPMAERGIFRSAETLRTRALGT